MYKKIIAAIIAAETLTQLQNVGFTIDEAFNAGKISAKDHEQLYDLLAKASNGYLFRSNVKHVTNDNAMLEGFSGYNN